MELQRPLAVVTPSVDGDVLVVLAGADSEFTPPQVQRMVGRWSEDGVRKALDRLVTQGVVRRRVAGAAGLYTLNREHLAAPAIVALASQRDELLRRLKDRFARWKPRADYVALFGSAARGDMRPDSDIDLFVVRPTAVDADDEDWREQMDQLERDVTAWTGNDARVLEYAATQVSEGLGAGDSLLGDVNREGIRLSGRPSTLRRTQRGGGHGER